MILPQTRVDLAAAIAERTRKAIANVCLPFKQEKVRVTVSGGISSTPGCHESQMLTEGDLIQAADEALYMAKSNGRNQIVFAGSAHEKACVCPVNAMLV